MEATVHDAPDPEPPLQEDPPSATNLVVQTEEDIVGESAAIIYKKSLEQLLHFMEFPIKTCSWSNSRTGENCNSAAPFDCNVKTRGTAYIAEWVNNSPLTSHI